MTEETGMKEKYLFKFLLRRKDDVFEYLQLLDKNIFARLFQMFDHVLIGELKKILNVVVANLTIELRIDVFQQFQYAVACFPFENDLSFVVLLELTLEHARKYRRH